MFKLNEPESSEQEKSAGSTNPQNQSHPYGHSFYYNPYQFMVPYPFMQQPAQGKSKRQNRKSIFKTGNNGNPDYRKKGKNNKSLSSQ